MARCAAIKRDGERCKAGAIPGEEWCYSHDPGRTEERNRNASKGGRAGGRGRKNLEVASIKSRLSEMVDEILTGTGEASRYAIANQVMNTILRAIDLERKIREQDEVLERIEALENRQPKEGGRQWGT